MAKDLTGKEIEAGDNIAYAISTYGKRPTLGLYKVLDVATDGSIRAKQTVCNGYATDPRISVLRLPSTRAAIVRKWNEVV